MPAAWWWGLIASIIIGLPLPLRLVRGSWLRIDAAGTMHYGHTHTANLSIALRDITSVQPVHARFLRGLAVQCDREAVHL